MDEARARSGIELEKPASTLSTSYKDARLILALGARFDCPLPLMSLYVQALASEVWKGKHNLDTATIVSDYSDLANLPAPR